MAAVFGILRSLLLKLKLTFDFDDYFLRLVLIIIAALFGMFQFDVLQLLSDIEAALRLIELVRHDRIIEESKRVLW